MGGVSGSVCDSCRFGGCAHCKPPCTCDHGKEPDAGVRLAVAASILSEWVAGNIDPLRYPEAAALVEDVRRPLGELFAAGWQATR